MISKKKNEFKVGDKVKIIDRGYILDHQDKFIGNGIIVAIEEGGGGWANYTFQNGYKNCYKENQIKLVEMLKFKNHDRVILSIPRNHQDWGYDGKTGMIITDDNNFGNSPNFKMVKIDGENSPMVRFSLDLIELIE